MKAYELDQQSDPSITALTCCLQLVMRHWIDNSSVGNGEDCVGDAELDVAVEVEVEVVVDFDADVNFGIEVEVEVEVEVDGAL